MTSAAWKRDFASGMIVFLPLLVSFWVIAYFYGAIASVPFLDWVAKELLEYSPITSRPFLVTLLTVLMTIVIFIALAFAIGYVMRTAVGELAESKLDDLMNQVPGLRVVYNASKMAVETAITGTDELRTPVKLEPWSDVQMTAFKTGKSTPEGRDILFLPTAPNITSGFVIEVDPDDYTEINERVEEALTRILSGGFGDSGARKIQATDPGVQPEGDASQQIEAMDGANASESTDSVEVD